MKHKAHALFIIFMSSLDPIALLSQNRGIRIAKPSYSSYRDERQSALLLEAEHNTTNPAFAGVSLYSGSAHVFFSRGRAPRVPQTSAPPILAAVGRALLTFVVKEGPMPKIVRLD